MSAIARLVDPRFGVVTHLTRFRSPPKLPRALVLCSALVAEVLRCGPWPADRVATGMAFEDEERARAGAVGEAVERYCGNFVPADLVRSSYRALRRRGVPAVDPAELVLYSDRQYAARGFPFVALDGDLEVLWVRGRDLATGEETLVPASLVYVNYFFGPRAGEPPTNFAMYAGLAAGTDLAHAQAGALEELIERDATVIWWHSGGTAPGLDVGGTALPALLAAAEPGIRYHFVHIRSSFEVPVVGALLVDDDLGIVGLGVAARPDPLAAAEKAAAEACSLWVYATGLLDPQGDTWTALRSGMLDQRAFKPYRADRRYLDDYRPDFTDVLDLGSQSQIYLDPRMRPHVEPLMAPRETVRATDLPTVDEPDRRKAYLSRLAARGLAAISVDVTTPDIRTAGLAVVRVVVPGLCPNAPAAFPFLGGRRLYSEPVTLGWRARTLTEDDMVLTPIPHT